MKRLIALAALALLSAPAFAVAVSCPGTVSTADREFSVTVVTGNGGASCFDFGTGNIIGADSDFAGYNFLAKFDTDGANLTGIGTTGGTFTIPLSAWQGFGELLIGFKSGEGQLDPDWAVFRLTPLVFSGLWEIFGNQSLSHFNVYGRVGTPPACPPGEVCTPDPQIVPEPGTLGLLGAGLFAFGWIGNRRRKVQG